MSYTVSRGITSLYIPYKVIRRRGLFHTRLVVVLRPFRKTKQYLEKILKVSTDEESDDKVK